MNLSCEEDSLTITKWTEVKWLICVWLFATPWTVAYQVSPSMEFSRQEYWSALPFLFPRGIFPTQELNWGLLYCRQTLHHLSHQGSPTITKNPVNNFKQISNFINSYMQIFCHETSLQLVLFLFFYIKKLIYFNWMIICLQYSGFCHTMTWITHGCSCVSPSWTPPHLPPHPIRLGWPRVLSVF